MEEVQKWLVKRSSSMEQPSSPQAPPTVMASTAGEFSQAQVAPATTIHEALLLHPTSDVPSSSFNGSTTTTTTQIFPISSSSSASLVAAEEKVSM